MFFLVSEEPSMLELGQQITRIAMRNLTGEAACGSDVQVCLLQLDKETHDYAADSYLTKMERIKKMALSLVVLVGEMLSAETGFILGIVKEANIPVIIVYHAKEHSYTGQLLPSKVPKMILEFANHVIPFQNYLDASSKFASFCFVNKCRLSDPEYNGPYGMSN